VKAQLVRPEPLGESKWRTKKGEELDNDECHSDRPQPRAGGAIDQQGDRPHQESDVGGGGDKSGGESAKEF
jgi:hypothetical protein